MTIGVTNKSRIKFKSGLKADINTTATKNVAVEGEPHYATDKDELYVFNGSKNKRVGRATYSDYSKTVSSTLPTSFAKIDFSGATLVSESESLFDATNSRVLQMDEDTVGKVAVSVDVDTSGGGGSAEWISFQLRGFDSGGTQLFAKRASTISLVKKLSSEPVHEELEFYFGSGVAYFEVWWEASSAMDYDDPAITVIKL